MSFHAISFQCYFCKRPRFTVAGAKFVWVGRYKRRMCADCVAKRRDVCGED